MLDEFPPVKTEEYGIFMDYRMIGSREDETVLLGHRFDTLDEAVIFMEDMTRLTAVNWDEFEWYVTIPEDRLPEGYEMMVYVADQVHPIDAALYGMGESNGFA